jgi:glutamine cyclotransferase
VDDVLAAHDDDPKALLAILEDIQAAYGYLPVAALKHVSRVTGAWYANVYGAATSYRSFRMEPPTVTTAAPAGEAQVAVEAGYLAALDAALGFGGGSAAR